MTDEDTQTWKRRVAPALDAGNWLTTEAIVNNDQTDSAEHHRLLRLVSNYKDIPWNWPQHLLDQRDALADAWLEAPQLLQRPDLWERAKMDGLMRLTVDANGRVFMEYTNLGTEIVRVLEDGL